MQGWTQPLQSLLYWRLPFSPRENDHSRRHFLLRLISRPAPGASSAGQACPGFSVPRTTVSRPPAAPGWKAFSPPWSCAPRLVDPIDQAIVILQSHFRRAQRVFRLHGNGYDLTVDAGKQFRPLELLGVLLDQVWGQERNPLRPPYITLRPYSLYRRGKN